MPSTKVIKDPIYGYIEISTDIVSNVIDTACFQRLRNVRQTSYAPLYPSSFHTRFTHSLGVYHLGKWAFRSAKDSRASINVELSDNLERYQYLFELACLLHDVGHAPFSHTGEWFFDNNETDLKITDQLVSLVDTDRFSATIQSRNHLPIVPHEIMSCIVALSSFGKLFNHPSEREFFSRCITGYLHQAPVNKIEKIENCFISLLNSPVIDVDRLDYIIRDSYTTGFENVSIDFTRLLNSVLIVKDGSNYCIGYHKNAVSVIENVVLAHDFERKWIQTHPSVLYEFYLLRHAMRRIDRELSISKCGHRIFSFHSLTREGTTFQDIGRISLLADEDILFLMKNKYFDELTNEYYERALRRRPIWKSEAEYKALFENTISEKKLDEIEDIFNRIADYINKRDEIPVINDILLGNIQAEIEKIKTSDVPEIEKDTLLDGRQDIRKWLECLKQCSITFGLPFDFVLVNASQFKSGYTKTDFHNIQIFFPSLNVSRKLVDVNNLLQAMTPRKNFFFLFYKRGSVSESGDNSIAWTLIKEFVLTALR